MGSANETDKQFAMIKSGAKNLLNLILRNNGYRIQKIVPDTVGYIENPEVGSDNFSEKVKRVEEGGPFEWPNMKALNQAIANYIGDAKKIVNIGSGTGTFEWHASVDNTLSFVASEFDQECLKWCKENRSYNNITYCDLSMEELLARYGKFDLAVSVDVIEHVKDFPAFLSEFSKLSERAILTTPNKSRDHSSLIAQPPRYYQHVREWTAGEFFWVLRVFYKDIELYAMPDNYVPQATRIGLLSNFTPLIAVCKK